MTMEIKARYYRDYQHNYLILKCEQEEQEMSYRYRMLSLNQVEGLLKYSFRNINGDTCLYYDISSRVSFENLYSNKKLSYGQVKDFFIQMDWICKNLSHYFLEEKELLLEPQYIYFDLTTYKYFGVYYPRGNAEEKNTYEALLDFLLTHIDQEDQRLTSKLYKFYEMAEDSLFSLADGAASFLDDAEGVTQTDIEAAIIKEGIITEDIVTGETDTSRQEKKTVFSPEAEYKERKAEMRENVNSRGTNAVFYVVLSVLFLLGSAGACWLYLSYELTQRELMVLFGCGVVMAIGCPLCIFLAWRTEKRKKEKEKADQQLLEEIEDEFRDSRQIPLHNVLEKGTYMPIREYGEAYMGNEEKETAQAAYGRTVFLDRDKQAPEYKLYALDPKNKTHISLTQFPYTIGKMAGCVDCVLTDASISRLHARIERKEGKIFLTDMNSTNGTYKNGLRMDPSETIEIEPGDEIRFGKLNYCYR